MFDPREQRLATAFVQMADTLVDDFDVLDFLHQLTQSCLELLPVDAAGLMLADSAGQLRIAASSSERVRLLELFELQNEEGPCLDCYRSGEAVATLDLGSRDQPSVQWPRFSTAAATAGFRSVLALPMRLRTDTIGALNLFRVGTGGLSPDDQSLAQALADVATIGILQERGSRRREVLARQLQEALTSRIVIEQAKGVLAERRGVHVDRAFLVLRDHARSTGIKLSAAAREVVDGHLDLSPDSKA